MHSLLGYLVSGLIKDYKKNGYRHSYYGYRDMEKVFMPYDLLEHMIAPNYIRVHPSGMALITPIIPIIVYRTLLALSNSSACISPSLPASHIAFYM